MLFFEIDEGLYEKLLSNGFTSLSAYCDEVELVTMEIAEEFSIKLIYYEFWQELNKKKIFRIFLLMKYESGIVKTMLFITITSTN